MAGNMHYPELRGNGFKLYLVRATKGWYKGKQVKKRKTAVYCVRKDSIHAFGELLGIIKWHAGWRGFAFFPENNTRWSSGCMTYISQCITFLNHQHKQSLKHRH